MAFLQFLKRFQYQNRSEPKPELWPQSLSPLVKFGPTRVCQHQNCQHSKMSLIRSHSQWPGGGYPSFIRRYHEPVAWEDFHAATRAWRCFVREQWVGGATADQQKRDLVERWATAGQEFRDVWITLTYIATFLLLFADAKADVSISSTWGWA